MSPDVIIAIINFASGVVLPAMATKPPAADCRPIDPVTYEVLSEACPAKTVAS